MEYRKVLAGDYNVRYIDSQGKWWRKHFNGKWTRSKPMPVRKEYGKVNLEIVDEGCFGLRIKS